MQKGPVAIPGLFVSAQVCYRIHPSWRLPRRLSLKIKTRKDMLMSGNGKLIGTFGPPIDVEFTGTPSVGSSIIPEIQASKLDAGQNYTLRTITGCWRICIMSVIDAVIANCSAKL
jgi:hypothetical protein